MNALVATEDRPKRALLEVVDPVPVLDTSRFEHMQRIANVMAQSTLIPESLYKEKDKELPLSQIISNCFLVVNQAVRWGLDPFAVAQSVAVVRGKLCYEGKLVAAVLDAKLGVRLHHHFTGDPAKPEYRIYISDQPWTEEAIAAVRPGMSLPSARVVDGSVAEWSTGDKSPWSAAKNYRRMLMYRGTRDWARFYEPAIMLGVYTPDEMLDLAENAKALRARDFNERPSLAERLTAARAEPHGERQPAEGFALENVAAENAAVAGEAAIEQEPSSAVSTDGAGGEDTADGGAGDAGAPTDTAEADGAGDEAADGQSAAPAPGELSDEQNKKLFVLEECADAMFAAATHMNASERADRLDKVRMAWLAELPKDKEFVQKAYETCARLVENPAGRDQVMPYLKVQARKWLGVA